MSNEEGSTGSPFFGEVVYSYSRAQALADGVLIDVSDTAREAGFRWPVSTATFFDGELACGGRV